MSLNPKDGAGASRELDETTQGTMSREELVALGGRLDGVNTVYKEQRWPIEGTKAEKRTERMVTFWLLLGGVLGLT